MEGAYSVKVENGYVKLFKSNGDFKRHICSNAVGAELKGNEVHVTTKDNKVKVFNVKGFYKKTL